MVENGTVYKRMVKIEPWFQGLVKNRTMVSKSDTNKAMISKPHEK